MVCVPCSQSHFSRCFEDLMLWGWQILFRIFWKVWTVSPEITHTRHPPPLPTSLTHTALSFPSFLHSLSYTFTSSLEQRHWFCIQFHSVGRLRGASWVTSPLDPRTGLLRARNRVLGPNPLLGMDRKMLKLPALGRSISHVSWVSSPHPYHQRAGSQGSWEQSSAHIVWLPPHPWQQATRRSHDPGTTRACWVPWLRIPRLSTLRMLSGPHCSDAKPLCSEVTGSDVPSHRTIAMCLHSCDLWTLENH